MLRWPISSSVPYGQVFLEPDAGTRAVLVDELNAGNLECFLWRE
jgi:hypothetical protein